MKSFNGPRNQGGWVAAAAMAVGAVANSYNQNRQRRQDKETQQEMTREGFARQAWLDQQARKWQLEDRAYKEGAIGGFRNAGPYTEKDFPGFVAPTPTSTTGLADWDPEKGVPGLMGAKYG